MSTCPTVIMSNFSPSHPPPNSQGYHHQLIPSDPQKKKAHPKACLFVAAIPPSISQSYLESLFSKVGTIQSISIVRDLGPRGSYAFVQYDTVESANQALNSFNGFMINGHTIRIEKAKVNRTLFLAKFPRSFSASQLRKEMEVYGPVEQITIIKDSKNQSRGCGFIKFIYREDSQTASQSINLKFPDWVVEWATSSNDPDILGVDKMTLFVGGLIPYQITQDILHRHFSQYGEIEKITLIHTPQAKDQRHTMNKNQPNFHAFAFIRFKSQTSSALAMENEDGNRWRGQILKVQYCQSAEMKRKKNRHPSSSSQSSFSNHYSNNSHVSNQIPVPVSQPSLPMSHHYQNSYSYLGPFETKKTWCLTRSSCKT